MTIHARTLMLAATLAACEPGAAHPAVGGGVGARTLPVSGLLSHGPGGDTVVVEAGSARDHTDTDWIEVAAGETREVDVTRRGPGGLDAGDPTAHATYALWIAKDPASGVVSALASVAFDPDQVEVPAGVLLRRVGALATDADAEVLAFVQSGGDVREVSYAAQPGVPVVVDGAASSFETVALAPVVPLVAHDVLLRVVPGGVSTNATTLRADASSDAITVTTPTTLDFIPSSGTSRMDYKNDATGGLSQIAVVGYSDPL